MPYIPRRDRERVWADMDPQNSGELNFIFTMVCKWYMDEKGQSYQAYADCLAALEGAKLELYRRKVAPYEDTKIKENGDV